MTEITKIFLKYLVCSLSKNPFVYFFPKIFVLREQIEYFQKIIIVSIISSNLNENLCTLPYFQCFETINFLDGNPNFERIVSINYGFC